MISKNKNNEDQFSKETLNNLNTYLKELQNLNEKTLKNEKSSLSKAEGFHLGIQNLLNLLQIFWIKKENQLKLSSIEFLDSKNNISTKKTFFKSAEHKTPLFTVFDILFTILILKNLKKSLWILNTKS